MARRINRLNARAVATITKYGRHADGCGLYLARSAACRGLIPAIEALTSGGKRSR